MSVRKDVLIVFAKEPVPGHVKTRLTSVLSPEEAAGLYEAFLRDSLDLYKTLKIDIRVYFHPAQDDSFFGDPAIHERVQYGNGLGERMLNAFREALDEGYDRAVIVGTDHPTLPVDRFSTAFDSLGESCDVVIGPSSDGGYYLLGCSGVYPELFQSMEYSHEHVFRETVQRIENARLKCQVLPSWYDIDTPEDVTRLIADLKESTLILPRTRLYTQKLVAKYRGLL